MAGLGLLGLSPGRDTLSARKGTLRAASRMRLERLDAVPAQQRMKTGLWDLLCMHISPHRMAFRPAFCS
jgi:hypothetical protein